MRVFTVIANLGWNLPRFLKQIGYLILGMAGLCVLAFTIFLYFWIYFDFNDPKSKWPIEVSAVERALSIPPDARPCYRNDLSRNNIRCYVPFPADRRNCRWWIMEPCRSFMAEYFLLDDPEKLGKVINAMIHPYSTTSPCLHSETPTLKDPGSCHESSGEHTFNPIVVEFVGGKKRVIMRID